MKINAQYHKFTFPVVLVLIVSLFIMYGCGQSTTTTTPTTPTTPAVSKYGGILRIGMPADARTLDTAFPGTQEMTILATACDPLYAFDEKVNTVPILAESQQVSPDGKTFTFKLKKGIKFHDGTDFNAEAVKFNLERFKESKHASVANIGQIDVVDDYTVRLNLLKPENTIGTNSGSVTLSGACGLMSSPTAFKTNGKDWVQKNVVGAGPYKFVSWVKDSKMVFEKFDGYWQKGKPYFDRIEFIIIADYTVAQMALQKGEIDLFYQMDPKSAKDLEKSGKFKVDAKAPSGALGPVGDGGNADSPFADIRVRQAVSYAIDNKAITDAFGYGYNKPINQLSHSQDWSYNPNVVGYPYNPQKAKDLLAEAGYANGFKTRIVAAPEDLDAFTAIQGFLSKVGINADLEQVTLAKWNEYSGKGWKNGLIKGRTTVMSGDNGATLRNLWQSGGVWNVSAFHSDEVDKLMNDSLAAGDYATKKNLTQQVIKLMIDKYCIASPVYEYSSTYPKNPKVHDDGMGVLLKWKPADAWMEK